MTPLAQLLAILSGGAAGTVKAMEPSGAAAPDGLFAALLQAGEGEVDRQLDAPPHGPGSPLSLPGIGAGRGIVAMAAAGAGRDLDSVAQPEDQPVPQHDQAQPSAPDASAAHPGAEQTLPAAVLRAQSPRAAEVLSALFGDAGIPHPLDVLPGADPATTAAEQLALIGEDRQQAAARQIEPEAIPAPNAPATEPAAPAPINATDAVPLPAPLDAAEAGSIPVDGPEQASTPDPGTAPAAASDAEPSAARTQPRQPAATPAPLSPQPHPAAAVASPPGTASQPAPTGAAAEAADVDTGAPTQPIKAPPGEASAKPSELAARAAISAVAARAFDPATGHTKPDTVSPLTSDAAPADLGPPRPQALAPPLVQAQAAQPAPHAPAHMLAVQIAAKALNGHKRFDIRLDPPELGRVEIRIDFARAGKMTTHLTVERAETLDLLQRDARMLERSLQQAGLDTAKDGLTFSLKDHGLARRDGDPATPEQPGAQPQPDEDASDEEGFAMRRVPVAAGRIDIRI